MFHPPLRGTAPARGAIPSMEYTIYKEQMILGHLSPPVASAGLHGRKWREITTKITDASNNKVNNNMPATYVLIFSLTIHLIDICGNVVECPDDAAERAAFYMLPLVQTTIYAHCRKAHETGVARRRHLLAAVEHKRREAAIDRAIGSVGCQLFCGLFLGPRSAVSQVTGTFPARKKNRSYDGPAFVACS